MRAIKGLILYLLFASFSLSSQTPDSAANKRLRLTLNSSENLEMHNSRAMAALDSILNPELRIGGYVSTYFAHYDDETENRDFVQFPTLAPRNDQFALNMALITLTYRSTNMRSNIALHYGDIPESSWPQQFNLIQEAYAGFRLRKKLWIDAGFFKSHIGLGSFQPRENITSSMAIPDFFSPYFLSGVKLMYYPTSKLSIHLCAFNGYNEYIDNNKNKAYNLTFNYNFNEHISVTYNFLTCDETPDLVKTKHQRYYQNLYATFIYNKFSIGADVSFGRQEHTLKTDTNRTATMYAGTLVGKYKFTKKLAIYARGETFSDRNDILTGKLDIGDYIRGITAGFEVKPHETMAVSFEWRLLESDKLIFRQKNTMLNQRNEFILCLDLWF